MFWPNQTVGLAKEENASVSETTDWHRDLSPKPR